MRVLIVEDNEGLCGVMREYLAENGHVPVIAHTAEAALGEIRGERPDVVVLDLHLPGMSGLEFLQLQTVRDASIPIIAVSGVATESQARECLRLGAYDFMGKPVPLERLNQMLACLQPADAIAALTHERQALAAAGVGAIRRSPRTPVTLPVHVYEYNGTQWEATSVDLSASGIKIRPTRSVSPGPAAKLSLPLPDSDEQLEVASVLVRADVDGYAFHFINLSDSQVRRLRSAVRQFMAGERGEVEPHLRILHTIAQTVSGSLDVDETLRIALDALTQVTGHEISSLHLLSPDGQTLTLHGDRGLLPRLREVNRTLRVGEGIIGRVAATGETIHVPDVSRASDLLPMAREVVAEERIRGFVCVPIGSHGRVLGTLALGRRTPEPFTEAEITLVEASANQIGLALDNARLYSETRRQLDDIKQAEAQLAEGERLSTVAKLATGLVHEINNPLAAILGQAEILMTRAEYSARDRDRLRVIMQETSRAATMLRSLLTFARGEPAAERRPCDLAAAVRWAIEVASAQLERHGIRVLTELGPAPAALADENRIRRIVLNLVQNAAQAMAGWTGERALTLRLSQASGRLRLEVLDSGPGIPPEALPRVFDAFFSTKPSGEGTGLGLWVSYGIAEQHGGRLWAENRPGGGAAFILELPLPADRS